MHGNKKTAPTMLPDGQTQLVHDYMKYARRARLLAAFLILPPPFVLTASNSTCYDVELRGRYED